MNEYWQLVRAARIYEIFERDIKPHCPRFSSVRKGILTKAISADITHIIKLTLYKGGAYGFRWGVSLAYVPHDWKNRLAWHRSAKSASLDLWEQAGPDMEDASVLPPDPEVLYASLMHGEKHFAEALANAWARLSDCLFSWLDHVTDLEGVQGLSERQTKRKWLGPQHWPPPALVHAFTVARMGNLDLAINELRSLTAEEDFDPNCNLPRALNKIAQT